MLRIVEEALTFDDLLLVPAHSTVLPNTADLHTYLTSNIQLNIPLISAAMDTVTESNLAIALAQEGGIGFIHKNMSIERQAEEVSRVKRFESGMVTHPVSVHPNATIAEVRDMTAKYGFAGFPVIDDEDNLLGIITGRDVRFVTDLKKKVFEVMTPKERLVTVREKASQDEVIGLMQKHRIEKVLVVDDTFHLKGMITVKDFKKAANKPNACKDALGRLRVGAAIGAGPGNNEARAKALVEAGVDVLLIDSSHGHSQGVLDRIASIRKQYPQLPIIGGNVATAEGAIALAEAGCSTVKVGIGPGSICTTRIVTGCGVPQMTAVANAVEALKGTDIKVEDIPADMLEDAKSYRDALVEAIAAENDDLMEKYFEDPESLTIDELKKGLRHAVCTNKIVPVTCGTAFKNKGVQLLLDSIVELMPSPIDVKAIEGELEDGTKVERHSSDDEPFSALAFKVMTDPYVGRLTFLRIYSGKLTSGSYVLNATNGKKERISRLVQMYADQRIEEDEVYAGDICAAVGLKDTTTGDTLCDEKSPIILERMVFPEPVISVAIEPKTKADQDKMGIALQKLAEEDPSFKVKSDTETGQTIISGMGELHLDIIVDRLLREFKVDANVGKPQVAYRETIRGNADQDSKFIRQSGGKGQYGHVKIKISPAGENEGFVFENKIVGGAIPKEYIEPARKGMEEALEGGILAGFPMIDVKVELYDGSYHEVDSSEMAFKIAGSMAIKEGCRKAKPCILEPMMKVEIEVPEENTGDIIGDISSRRGRVEGMEIIEGTGIQKINAIVPLAEMFGYATDIRSKTQGRGTFSMEFKCYEQVPANIEKEIIEKSGVAKA